jgi:hypothetical protein
MQTILLLCIRQNLLAVSLPALASQSVIGKTLQEFPSESYLSRLKTYQLTTMNSLCDIVKSLTDHITWRDLAEVTKSHVIAFNVRRGSEVAALMLADYVKKSNYVDETVLNRMTENEKEPLPRLSVPFAPVTETANATSHERVKLQFTYSFSV